MAMAGPLLAEEIRAEMGFPPPTSVPIIGWATGFVRLKREVGTLNHELVGLQLG